MLSPINPPLTKPVVEEMEEDTPTSEVDELQITSPESGMPPIPSCRDIPEETKAPEVVVPRPPSSNSLSEVIPAVGYACLP